MPKGANGDEKMCLGGFGLPMMMMDGNLGDKNLQREELWTCLHLKPCLLD